MNTPICDFVQGYADKRPLRLHMPGHKGCSRFGVEHLDITEISGADVLYQAQGIIAESERNAAALFGTGKTLYSTEGSSLSIRAMLYLVALYAAQRGKKPAIAAGRNAHKVFIMTAAVLGLAVDWLYPTVEDTLLSCTITPEALERCLSAAPERYTAVYLTSPDYLGHMADICALAAICHRYDVLLLVDNAHGAYLRFLPENCHPVALGADLCCDSAHKTLPVLTGGAYLHISRQAPAFMSEHAARAMALFASTSPSYLILQSLDQANSVLADDFAVQLSAAVDKLTPIRQALHDAGYGLTGDEPMKLTICPKPYGYTGIELSEILEAQNIFCEFADPDHLVMMFSGEIPARLSSALLGVERRPPCTERPPILPRPHQMISPHEAIFRPACSVPVTEAVGKIMASACVSCPPAIPVVACGEQIDEAAVSVMQYYGISHVQVVQ